MKLRNKYGYISGGYIFDITDRNAHDVAIKHIGECVTSNATVNFFEPIEYDLFVNEIKYEVRNKTNSTITIAISYKNNFLGLFTFVKIKKGKTQ